MVNVPRGLRNCNPGNIRKSTTAWKGETFEQNDPDFVTFETPEYGLRAMAVILKNYQRKHGLNTVRQIINRWAPPQDSNDTSAYVDAVAAQLGVEPDDRLNLETGDDLTDLIAAIVHHENGKNPFTIAQITEAVSTA